MGGTLPFQPPEGPVGPEGPDASPGREAKGFVTYITAERGKVAAHNGAFTGRLWDSILTRLYGIPHPFRILVLHNSH